MPDSSLATTIGVVKGGIERADAAAVARPAYFAVAIIHEAMGRVGLKYLD